MPISKKDRVRIPSLTHQDLVWPIFAENQGAQEGWRRWNSRSRQGQRSPRQGSQAHLYRERFLFL